MRTERKRILSGILALGLLAACQSPQEPIQETGDNHNSLPDAKTRAKVQFKDPAVLKHIRGMGLNPDEAMDFGSFYLFEGCIRVEKSDLQAGMAAGLAKTAQAWDNYLVDQQRVRNVRVYLVPGTGSASTPSAAEVQQAVADWNAMNSTSIQLTYVTSPSNADVTIQNDGGALDGSGYIAMAGFPGVARNAYHQILVNWPAYSAKTASQRRFTLAHELGHCLGYRHTNWAARGEPSARNIPGTPTSDPLSVMNAVVQDWTGFSTMDQIAAGAMYPDYVTFSNGPWSSTKGMTQCGGSAFIVDNSILYKVDPVTGSRTSLSIPGLTLTNTRGMTSIDNSIYVVDNGRLLKIDPFSLAYSVVGPVVWGNVRAMTALNGYLYIVNNSSLFQVNPVTGGYVQRGTGNWIGTIGMASLAGNLHIVAAGVHYRVPPSGTSWTALQGSWTGAQGITALGSHVYISSAGSLHRVESSGAYVQTVEPLWGRTAAMTSLGDHLHVMENSQWRKIRRIDP